MAKLIYERAIHVHPETGELLSYWPEYWPIERLAKKWRAVTSGPFGAGYQNDPNALSGNALQREWLHFYDQEMLDDARRRAGVAQGTRHAGADPTRGGSGRDPDYFAAILVERIDNQAFFIDMFNRRLTIDEQAQFLEDWISVRGGILTGVIEDTSEKGYVWNDLQQLNKDPQTGKPQGSRYPWVVEKAQGKNAVGAKELRFLAMAPRFRSGQVMIPGIRTEDGWKVDPKWDIFVQEWCSFPSGHDDLLDAAFWACFATFGKEAPAAAIKYAGSRPNLPAIPQGSLCENRAHIKFGKPLDQCARCMTNFQASQLVGRELPDSQTSRPTADDIRRQRARVGIGLRTLR